jgi:hypothetical protein
VPDHPRVQGDQHRVRHGDEQHDEHLRRLRARSP